MSPLRWALEGVKPLNCPCHLPVHLGPVFGYRSACLVSEDKLREDVACKVNKMANGNAKPVKKIKVGAIDAAVWKNTIKQAKTDAEIVSLSVTMERRYKDQDGEWQGTNSYRINDIPKAVLALQKAYEFIAMDAGHQEGESANSDGDAE